MCLFVCLSIVTAYLDTCTQDSEGSGFTLSIHDSMAFQAFNSPPGEADAFCYTWMHLQKSSSKPHHFTTKDRLQYHDEGV